MQATDRFVLAHEQRAKLVATEMRRLEASPATAPFGGWYVRAVRDVAASEGLNPYELDRQVRPYITRAGL